MALDAAIECLNLDYGDEVIVTPRSYMSSASCIVRAGCVAKFVDVELNSQNINAQEILKSINKKTKAIICVHLAGFPCDMSSIMKIAKKYKLKVIEDCSQAHGAMIKNKKLEVLVISLHGAFVMIKLFQQVEKVDLLLQIIIFLEKTMVN